MNTTELIDLLRELEEEAGEPVQVQALVRVSDSRNQLCTVDSYDVELVRIGSGRQVRHIVRIDMS